MQIFHFLIVILFILVVITVLIYKINKLYNYFIISKNDKKLSLTSKEISPVNGDCPTQGQLNNL